MQLYAITQSVDLASRKDSRSAALVRLAEGWSRAGVDYVQIREKDLAEADLVSLATAVVQAIHAAGMRTRVLLNGSWQAVKACGADGIHLPGGWQENAADSIAAIREQLGEGAVISVSCHSVEEASLARGSGASLVLFAPVFGKQLVQPDGERRMVTPPQGLAALQHAVQQASPLPVFALGGITPANAGDCVEFAGAAGVAGIRLFQQPEWRRLLP